MRGDNGGTEGLGGPANEQQAARKGGGTGESAEGGGGGGGGGGSKRPRAELFGKQCVRISVTVQKHAFI